MCVDTHIVTKSSDLLLSDNISVFSIGNNLIILNDSMCNSMSTSVSNSELLSKLRERSFFILGRGWSKEGGL